MIRLFRYHLLILFFALAACSSNTNVGQDDLSISEIEDIEKTGEFSEEDFFKDEEILRQSGVEVDIEGLDDSNLESKGDDLVADLDIEDFEGESFDSGDDFETDLEGSGDVAEFDEFDEFVTTDKVAKNEDIIKEEQPQVGDIANQPTMTEEDIFSEFEESTDVANQDSSVDSSFADDIFAEMDETPVVADKTAQPDLEFEDVFNESDSSVSSNMDVADSTPQVDTTLDTDVNASDYQQFDDMPASEVVQNNIPSPKADNRQAENMADGRTAKEILSQEQYEQPEQIATAITRQVRAWIPVKKMKEEPYRQNGILLNALYVVREGDTFKSIGEKIYGKGSINNLAMLNPYLNPKRLKVGEKIYYNSPNRPNDEMSMLFYYDDIGRTPQYRQADAGENVRTISQELLGHPRSWMEIWATNPEIVSKFDLERPHRIKYFAKNDDIQSMVQDSQTTSDAQGDLGMSEGTQSIPTDLNDQSQEVVAEQDQMSGEPDFDQGFEDEPMTAETEPDFDQGFDDQVASNEPVDDGIGSIPQSLNPPVGNQVGGLQQLLGMDQKMIETVAMGAGGLVLIIALLLIARRRRMYAQATEVQEFDFAGSTKIDEQTKTHIDI